MKVHGSYNCNTNWLEKEIESIPARDGQRQRHQLLDGVGGKGIGAVAAD
jgi:hypothetical protein